MITLMRAAEKISWDEYAKYFYKCRDNGKVTEARGFRHAWLIGFINRINERFDEEKSKMREDKTGTALVRYDSERMDVKEFIKDMGLPPTPSHTIDRVDRAKGYCKENCRWATVYEQNYNRSCSRFVTIDGVRKTLLQACRDAGLKYVTVYARMMRYGYSVEEALTTRLRRRRATS